MSLITLQNKSSKDILKLLSSVSSSLLPNPSVLESTSSTDSETKLVNLITQEIRQHLKIADNDYSVSAQSKIFSFLSKEISNVALKDENILKVKKRLGGKGELPLNQYNISIRRFFAASEALGEKKSNALETIKNPDKFLHITGKYAVLNEEGKVGVTLFVRSINTRKADDSFIQIVLCARQYDRLEVWLSFRLYISELKIKGLGDPLELLKAFVDCYGLIFTIDGITTKFLLNNVVNIYPQMFFEQMIIENGVNGGFYLPVSIGNVSDISSVNFSSKIGESVMGFILNIDKYVATLKKHNVHLKTDNWLFPKIGETNIQPIY